MGGDYYYQINGDIDNSTKASQLSKWRTTDLSKIANDGSCMNVKTARFNKSGSKTMDKDDNEAMFVPKGYAILGFDHDDCSEGGNGVQFYHGYHENSDTVDNAKLDRIKNISGNKPGGLYNYKGSNNGRDEDQPRNISDKLSSWRVYDLNEGLGDVIKGLDAIEAGTTGTVRSNKSEFKRILCKNVDKDKWTSSEGESEEVKRNNFNEQCEGILNLSERNRLWPKPVVLEEDSASETYSEPDDEIDYFSDDDEPDDDEPDDEKTPKTNWLLYGGIASGAICCIVVVIIVVLLMKKKKIPKNSNIKIPKINYS